MSTQPAAKITTAISQKIPFKIPPYALVVMALKVLRILLSWVSLFLATRIFTPIYEDLVYEQKKDPPSLNKYIGIFLGLDIAFNAFVIVMLVLTAHIFKTDKNTFPIDSSVIKSASLDYGMFLLITASMGSWFASVMSLKRYFRYKYEGLRAVRAFERILLTLTTHIHLLPLFLIVPF